MKLNLNQIYHNIIIENLLNEDRNQAKSLLKKAGITTDNWRINPNYPNQEQAKYIVQFVKNLTPILLKYKKLNDLGFWTKIIIETLTSLNLNDYYFLPTMLTDITNIYSLGHELKINPIKDNNQLPKDITPTKYITTLLKKLKNKWTNHFINKYIPKPIFNYLKENGDEDKLIKPISNISDNKKLRKRLIKLHKKFNKFLPYDQNGNPRTHYEIYEIIDYIEYVIENEPYDTTEKLNQVKNSNNKVIFEGPGQLLVQIYYDDAEHDFLNDFNENEKICHASENWCIISNPNESWENYAGTATFVLFNKNLDYPYNRIAVVYEDDNMFQYWDENDDEITDKINKIIPNIKEIENAILLKGDLEYEDQRLENVYHEKKINGIFENMNNGELLTEDELEFLLDNGYDTTVDEYLENIINNPDIWAEPIYEQIYPENLIPNQLKDKYYNTIINELIENNQAYKLEIYNLNLIPEKYRAKLPNPIDEIKKDILNKELDFPKFKNYLNNHPNIIENLQKWIIKNWAKVNNIENHLPIILILKQDTQFSNEHSDSFCQIYNDFILNTTINQVKEKYLLFSIENLNVKPKCVFNILIKLNQIIGDDFVNNRYIKNWSHFPEFLNYIKSKYPKLYQKYKNP